MQQNKKKSIEDHWYQKNLTWLTFLLLPFSWLFRLLIAIRFFLYRIHFFKRKQFDIPIIVVGNLTVGGTGKTPFVIWLADCLQKKGFHPGIVSRGVGAKESVRQPYQVNADSSPEMTGDEALLIARRTKCPVVVCVDRVLAVDTLLKNTDCNVVISDDGLQHYRMARSMEVVVVDGVRKWGNKQLLPAGPLRESVSRLDTVDLIVTNGEDVLTEDRMNLHGETLVSLMNPAEEKMLDSLQNQTVHAIAGIGNPDRFFSLLRRHNVQIIEHVFPDHYLFKRDDIYFCDNLAVIMTEKDAVKCTGFADERHWFLPVFAEMSSAVEKKFFSKWETL